MIHDRRWQLTTILTLVATLGSLLAVWQVASARTIRCLQAPRCTRPPCDYFRQLEMWSVLKGVYQSPALRERMRADARRANPGMTGAALDAAAATLLAAEVKRQSQPGGDIAREIRPCSGSPIPEPPGMRTTDECLIVDNAAPADGTNRERAHERYDTCSEFINAVFDHEELHQTACRGSNSTARAHMGIDDFAKEEAAGYEAAIKRLKAGLRWWAATCAKNADREMRRQVIADGTAALARRVR